MVNLQIQFPVGPTGLDALIDDAHIHARRHLAEQELDILGIKPDAAMRDLHPDSDGIVGPVNQV